MSILVIHEMGHVLAAIYFHWNIQSVRLYPFGALTMFQEHLNKPMKEEMLIVIMGPIFQCIYYFLMNFTNHSSALLTSFHYGLLGFNLLPIIPLDGSKIFHLFCQEVCSYYRSMYILFLISSLSLFFFGAHMLRESFIWCLIFLLLLGKGLEMFYKKNAVFSKFVLERVLYTFSFPKRKVIYGKRINAMKRDTKHLFCIDGKQYTEKQILQKMFDFKGKRW